MDCRFCKLENIKLLDDTTTFKCPYCGYAFQSSRTGILYDKMMQMPLSTWLLASILWFFAMLTGVAFGAGFNTASLSTTILFLFIYGGCAFLFGFSTSLDMLQTVWIWFRNKITRKSTSLEEVKEIVQELRKKKIVSEMATGQSLDESTGQAIETDIRPGEKRTPKISPSFLAGLYTLILGAAFVVVFNVFFPPFTWGV
ncbi:MAG: hypothetical protein H7645_00885 [Candidatus Heimdallarchaeota archaeon]|nr:hypothetical protein [Candidatus Heimdallarchaeota archaeon]MCK4768870.1 hypothetical protein [Candidatus Heimdallarchaeota archaeon]